MAKEVRAISDARWPDGVRLPVALTFEHQSGEGTPLLPGDRPNYMMGGALEYGGRTGICRGLNGGDVATDDRRDETGADLLVPDELHVRGLDHRVGGLDHRNETFGLDHS